MKTFIERYSEDDEYSYGFVIVLYDKAYLFCGIDEHFADFNETVGGGAAELKADFKLVDNVWRADRFAYNTFPALRSSDSWLTPIDILKWAGYTRVSE